MVTHKIVCLLIEIAPVCKHVCGVHVHACLDVHAQLSVCLENYPK